MTRRIAIYARVSTMEQAGDTGTSIEKQLKAGRLEAERISGFVPAAYVVKTYVDEGVSGATRFEDRKAGAELLKDAGRGKFDTVVFYSLDRFTRSVAKGLTDYELMEDDLGLTLIFAKENIDTSQPSGMLFRTILMAFAEFERDTIRDRSMAGRLGAAKKGQGWTTGRPPFGFLVHEDDGHLIQHANEAFILRKMFARRAAGYTLAEVAWMLNKDGHRPRPRGPHSATARFSAGSVLAYLRKPYYKGEPIVRNLKPSYQGVSERFEYAVPQIISADVWDIANGTDV